jgi:hypothetical protein
MKGLLTVLSLVLLLSSAAISAAAQGSFDPSHTKGIGVQNLETYVRLFGGVTFDGRLRNIEGTGGLTGLSISRLGLASSVLYGGKFGAGVQVTFDSWGGRTHGSI